MYSYCQYVAAGSGYVVLYCAVLYYEYVYAGRQGYTVQYCTVLYILTYLLLGRKGIQHCRIRRRQHRQRPLLDSALPWASTLRYQSACACLQGKLPTEVCADAKSRILPQYCTVQYLFPKIRPVIAT